MESEDEYLKVKNLPNLLDREKDVIKLLDYYQEQPNLLDPYLEHCISHLLSLNNSPNYKLLYYFTKVRGFKTILKFFPHEVVHLEKLLEDLKSSSNDIWEKRYILLLWLSLVIRLPFDLDKIDSTGNLIASLIELCRYYLSFASKERDAAVELLSRLLTRKDMKNELEMFFKWGLDNCNINSTLQHFLSIGILASFCGIFKFGDRKSLLVFIPSILITFSSNNDLKELKSPVIRKYLVKLYCRMGLTFLPPKVSKWRYHLGNRILSLKNKPCAFEKLENSDTEEEENSGIDGSVEEIISHLLIALQDKDTIVRWSAAKGIGRICQRLPSSYALDVVHSIIECFSEDTILEGNKVDISSVSDQTWHGLCLSLAELSRRGALLPESLEEIVPWISRALTFDQQKGVTQHALGANVRDAACYVCWSFARAYSPEVLKCFVSTIAVKLIITSVYDREINIRRAASAAFQENVGRQGIFPHGIDIITVADYFSLGNRNSAFHISVAIAKLLIFLTFRYPEYSQDIINHLFSETLFHWDPEIRVLASKTCLEMTLIRPDYILSNIMPQLYQKFNSDKKDLKVRHGCILAIAEVLFGLEQLRLGFNDEKILNLPKTLFTENIGFFSGCGSDLFLCGISRFIECCSKFYSSEQDIKFCLNILELMISRKERLIQENAGIAYGELSKKPGLKRETLLSMVSNLRNPNVTLVRGYVIVLGSLMLKNFEKSDFLIAIKSLIEVLSHCEVECRECAIMSLATILCDLDMFQLSIDHSLFLRIFDALLNGLSDYQIDSRGDIGSIVREAAMLALSKIVKKVYPTYFSKEMENRLYGEIIKQCAEKIDRIRICAGNTLIGISEIIHFPLEFDKNLDWAHGSNIFKFLTELLHFPEYMEKLLSGMVISIGGLTESLARISGDSFCDFIEKNPSKIPSILDCLLILLEKNNHVDRVIIPLFKTLSLLLNNECIAQVQYKDYYMKFSVCVKKEMRKSRDVDKLLSGIDIFCSIILGPSEEASQKSVEFVLPYLLHPFPKIRFSCAEKLYVSIISLELYSELAVDLLLKTDWKCPVKEIQQICDRLYTEFHISKK